MSTKTIGRGIKLGSGFRLTKSNKIEADESARLARLPVNKRIAARNSKKIRVAKPIRPGKGGL